MRPAKDKISAGYRRRAFSPIPDNSQELTGRRPDRIAWLDEKKSPYEPDANQGTDEREPTRMPASCPTPDGQAARQNDCRKSGTKNNACRSVTNTRRIAELRTDADSNQHEDHRSDKRKAK